eukprot:840867-Rhodomonas_salina.1
MQGRSASMIAVDPEDALCSLPQPCACASRDGALPVGQDARRGGAAVYSADAAIHGANTAIYGTNAPIYGGDVSIYGVMQALMAAGR